MLVTVVVVAAAGRTEGLSWAAQEMASHKVASSDASRDVAVTGVTRHANKLRPVYACLVTSHRNVTAL